MASYIGKIEYVQRNICRVQRLVEEGHEVLDVELPAVLTVVKEVSDPRLPTLRGKQKAKKVEIPVWGNEYLETENDKVGLNGSPTRVVKIFRPKVTRKCEKYAATDKQTTADALDKLMAFLRKKELI